MTKLKNPVKEALKFREKIYIDLRSHWTLKSCLWGRPEKSLGTPGLKHKKAIRFTFLFTGIINLKNKLLYLY